MKKKYTFSGRKVTILLFVLCFPIILFAQTATMNNSGNWDDATRWASSNIGDNVNETTVISNNTNPTVRSGFTYFVGNTTLNNNNTLSVAGTLNVGDASNSRSLTTNNNANISVSGTLIIWGNVVVNNNINWTISGNVIIKGNLVMTNNANVTVSGNLRIDGNFTGGNGTNVTVSGGVSVGGTVNVGNGSNLNGCAGCFQAGGACTGPANFCSNGTLPITLLFFEGKGYDDHVLLKWATAAELNFDRFVIEKTRDGNNYYEVGEVPGNGLSNSRIDYSFEDPQVMVGRTYYRLKAIDFDGYAEYFGVIPVIYEGINEVNVFPNPAPNGQVNFSINYFSDGPLFYKVLDLSGSEIDSGAILQQGFENDYTIAKSLSAGFYLLVVYQGDEKKVVRFAVL